jgi:hypothetical protein
MTALRLFASTLGFLSARPSAWLLALVLVLVGPSVSVLAPVGISSHSTENSAWIYDLAFLGLVAGTAHGVDGMTRLGRTFAHSGIRPSVFTRSVVLAGIALVHAPLAILPLALLSAGSLDPWALHVLPRATLLIGVLAALGALLLACRLPRGLGPWLLGAGAAIAPLLLPSPIPVRSLLALTFALFLAAALLDHPRRRTA